MKNYSKIARPLTKEIEATGSTKLEFTDEIL